MLVSELLQENLDKSLVGVPAGSVVIEMAEVLLGEELPQFVTGSELSEKIAQVTPPYRDNLLNHSLDDAIVAYRTWASLTKTEQFRSSIRVLDLTVMAVVLMSMFMFGMFALEYFNHSTLPTYEQTSVVFLPMAIVLAVQYALNNSVLLALIARFLYRRYKL